MTIAAMEQVLPTRTWRVADAISDLVGGVTHWELWSTLAWHDIKQRYRRSVVGPFWLTLSMGTMIGGLAYLYSGVFGQKLDEYLPFVALGMILFNFITMLATDGSTAFISAGPVIVQIKAPLSMYVYQVVWRNVLILAHNILIYVVVLVFVPWKIGWNMLLAIPGLLLLISIGVWVGLLLGALCARFRDIPPIVASVMQIAFFMTPVFWVPGSLTNRELFVHLNPFYYLLEIVRQPLLGNAPPAFIWLAAIAMSIVGAVASTLFFARYRARIAYWV